MWAATKPFLHPQYGVTTMLAVTLADFRRLDDIRLRLGFFNPNGGYQLAWLTIIMSGSSGLLIRLFDGSSLLTNDGEYLQSQWNLDPMDGTGRSKANLAQLTDGDSLTFVVRCTNHFVGRLMFGILWRKKMVWIHENTVVGYWKARFGLSPACKQYMALTTNAATSGFTWTGAATMWTECALKPTYQNSITTALNAAKSSGTGGTLVPVLTLAASYQHVMLSPTAVSIYNSGTEAVTVQLVQDATLTGASYIQTPFTTPYALFGRGITYDRSASAMSGGRPLKIITVAPNSAVTVPVRLRRPMCYPYPSLRFVSQGTTPSFVFETLTIGATTSGGVAQGVFASMDYDEYGAIIH
jgi:hypothetical protein